MAGKTKPGDTWATSWPHPNRPVYQVMWITLEGTRILSRIKGNPRNKHTHYEIGGPTNGPGIRKVREEKRK